MGHFISVICIRMLFLFVLTSIIGSLYAQRPVAYYTFDNSPKDQSGNNNHGVLYGNVKAVSDRFGNPCSAYYFDGVSGYIKVPSSPTLEAPENNFTICAWYKIAYNGTTQHWLTVACKGESQIESAENPQYRLQVQQNTDQVLNACSLFAPSSSSTISLCTELTACDNQFERHLFEVEKWHFYTMTYDGREMKAYMDGKLIFSTPFSKPLLRNTSPLYIGMDEPGKVEYFKGALDDVRIYNVTLSDVEIDKLFKEKKKVSAGGDFEMPFQQNIYTYAASDGCTARSYFSIKYPSSSCGHVQMKQTDGLPSGSEFPIGRNRVVFESISSSGYKEVLTFFVIVIDTIPPRVAKPLDTVIYIPPSQSDIILEYLLPEAADNCKLKTMGVKTGPSPGQRVKSGKYQIVFEAEDYSGNRTTVSRYIEVVESPDFSTKDTLDLSKVTVSLKDTQSIVVPSRPELPDPDTIADSLNFDKDTLSNQYVPNHISFLIDASSSMSQDNKIEILKKAVINIVRKMRTIDYISIITYADTVSVLLRHQPVNDKRMICNKIENIRVFGGTEVDDALDVVYKSMQQQYLVGGNNDIYLATDGLFTLGKRHRKLIQNASQDQNQGITLNILAFGASARSLSDLRTISDWGRGQFLYISNEEEATTLILNQIKINSKK